MLDDGRLRARADSACATRRSTGAGRHGATLGDGSLGRVHDAGKGGSPCGLQCSPKPEGRSRSRTSSPRRPGPRDVVVAARRQRRLPLRPVAQERLRRHHARHGPRPRGRGHDRRGRQGRHRRSKKGDHIVASFIPACGICWFCLHDQSHLCDTEFEVMMAHARQARRRHRLHDDDRPRHVRRGDDRATSRRSSRSTPSVPDDQLALIGCGVTTGVGAALNTAQVQPGRDRRDHRLRRCRPGRASRAPASPARRRSSRSTRSR